MSKSTVSALLLGLATVGVISMAIPAAAADMAVPAARAARACPRCGCVQVWYIHHPELRSTYGLDYDPRNYDQTEPHYYHGPVRAYPRYAVEGGGPIE